MEGANSVIIEGYVGDNLVHYPARDADPEGKGAKKELLSFDLKRRDGRFLVQAYTDVARSAANAGIRQGDHVYVKGILRCTLAKARCGRHHRFLNIVAWHIERREPPLGGEAESLGEAPENW